MLQQQAYYYSNAALLDMCDYVISQANNRGC